ncbi:hypothetical protein B0H15DRAFT_943322 [Mycena belliarum]|uniref:Uncharacterized protein n=1 Tax=Mycena belliarum TaxID=1033014 RepID=A0AAD6XYU8_9AGAR|nr:hypothetical protein B0H15DRAFT_943322 [Mycena belliae]
MPASTYISSLPHPGPPPTSPLPPLPMKAGTVKRARRVPTKKVSPPAPRIPEGYAFAPPSVPLTYPASYHLIPAGPMNAAPKRKRPVFQTLTNLADKVRLPKRKELVADLADESFCCRGGQVL